MNNNFIKTNIAQSVWDSKYKYKDESPIETQERIAEALASVEKDPVYWKEKFLKTLLKFENNIPTGLKCVPGGRISANIGTGFEKASLYNCYVNGPIKNAKLSYERKVKRNDIEITIPVEYESPDTGDNMINIILTMLEQALTLGSEGGWGMNFSFIRPRGTLVKGIGVEHPGVVKFMEVFDKMAEVIVAGNNDGYSAPLKNHFNEKQLKELKNIFSQSPKKKQSRKGAQMGILDVSHPDIEEFITAKQKGGKLTKFNLSVMISDEFMQAVGKNDFFNLEFNGIVYKKIKARELYDLIMTSTYNRAEPGVLFYGNMQKNNPISYLVDMQAVNPCVVGDTLILTSIGWVQIQNLYNWYNLKLKLPKIITMNKFKELENAELEKVMLTEENAELYKICFSNSEFVITNIKHKFYTETFEEIKVEDVLNNYQGVKVISGEGLTEIVEITKLPFQKDVFDLTANPNYNFFSLLNKEEFIVEDKVVINDCLELDYFSVVKTETGNKFVFELTEKDVIL